MTVNRFTASKSFLLSAGLAAFALYLAAACFYLPPRAFWSPDEGAKYLQMMNLDPLHGEWGVTLRFPGRDIDPELKFAPSVLIRVINGNWVFPRLPILALLTFPVYRLLGVPGLYVWPALTGALCGVLALALVEPPQRRLGMWLAAAFGSPIAVYAVVFWEHDIAAALGLAGMWLMISAGDKAGWRPDRKALICAGGGVTLGLAVYVRFEMLLFAAALLLAAALVTRARPWGALWTAGAFSLTLTPFPALNQLLVGRAVPGHLGALRSPFIFLSQEGLNALTALLVAPKADIGPRPDLAAALWTGAAVLAIMLSLAARDQRWRVAAGVTVFTAACFLFRPFTAYNALHGLLIAAPWLIIGVCRGPELWRSGETRVRLLLAVNSLGWLAYIVGIMSVRDQPQGGAEWGARFGIVYYPLTALLAFWPAAPTPDSGDHTRLARLTTVALLLLGIGFQLRGVRTIDTLKTQSQELDQSVLSLPARYVATTVWWRAPLAAFVLNERPFFVVSEAPGLAAWIEQAAGYHVEEFTLVTFDTSQLLADADAQLTTHTVQIRDLRQVGGLTVFRVAILPGRPAAGLP